MKRLATHIIAVTFEIFITSFAFAQTDTLIRFSDLVYHSEFEKEAVTNFVLWKRDTFELFLAIDENISPKEAAWRKEMYIKTIRDLNDKKIQTLKINKKIKLSYSIIHDKFLKKYNENEYFPVIFQTGTYNCVSATMLYSLVFDELDIPFNVKVSSNHVYLVANPGSNSVVIETTNPGFEKQIFNGEFKQQYVNYLKSSKLISETDFKNKSVEEIFEEKFNELKDAEFSNLIGFQYYNKALSKLQNNDIDNGLELCKKAYFFYPDDKVKMMLFNCLIFYIEKCQFDKVTDIDYLAQYSKFENSDLNAVVGIFGNIINQKLQFTNKEAFCDSIHTRLISQLSNKKVIEEIDFNYYSLMSYRYQNSDKIEKYVTKALDIKGNHQDANTMFENFLQKKLFSIQNSDMLLDSITELENKYHYENAKPILFEHKLRAFLLKTNDAVEAKKMDVVDKNLLEFEHYSEMPLKSQMLRSMAESTYWTVAIYYYNKGNKTKAETYTNRGLKYVPDSRLLGSGLK